MTIDELEAWMQGLMVRRKTAGIGQVELADWVRQHRKLRLNQETLRSLERAEIDEALLEAIDAGIEALSKERVA